MCFAVRNTDYERCDIVLRQRNTMNICSVAVCLTLQISLRRLWLYLIGSLKTKQFQQRHEYECGNGKRNVKAKSPPRIIKH
jgi:hypothetical protein